MVMNVVLREPGVGKQLWEDWNHVIFSEIVYSGDFRTERSVTIVYREE